MTIINLLACQQQIKENVMSEQTQKTWEQQVDEMLPVLGHRNWIIVADMAYPQQSKEGITTIYIGEGQVETVQKVFEKIKAAPHVRANVYLDKELDFVNEKYAKGIGQYRKELEPIIGNEAQKIMHEELIGKLDKAAKMFNVLILKTDMVLPYTSVFFELECGYWSEEAENELRRTMMSDTKAGLPDTK